MSKKFAQDLAMRRLLLISPALHIGQMGRYTLHQAGMPLVICNDLPLEYGCA